MSRQQGRGKWKILHPNPKFKGKGNEKGMLTPGRGKQASSRLQEKWGDIWGTTDKEGSSVALNNRDPVLCPWTLKRGRTRAQGHPV